LNFELISQ
jgi:hypothetical protein